MVKIRNIHKVMKSKPTLEGAGVHLHRVFGYSEVPLFDPFLLLDDFRSDSPELFIRGFPWHPHRGIETITYVLSGDVEHGDSLGNQGVISSGDVQWMTAGSGIIHQEMPKGDKEGRMLGFQLWANLPAKQKMMQPRYRDVKQADTPVVTLPNKSMIRVISGEVLGTKGPVQDIVTDPLFLDVKIPPGCSFSLPIKAGYTAFAYVIEGQAYFCKERKSFSYTLQGNSYFDMAASPFISNRMLVLYEDGEQVDITTEQEGVRFLLIAGRPLKEPVAWYGPIVMNTQAELETAFREYEQGTFIKTKT